MSKYILVNPDTLEDAISKAVSGDTIVFDDSEYHLTSNFVVPEGVKLTSVYGIRRGRSKDK